MADVSENTKDPIYIESTTPISFASGKLIAMDSVDGDSVFEDVKGMIEGFERQDWVRRIVFKIGQKLIYTVAYSAEHNKIIIGARISDEHGKLTLPPPYGVDNQGLRSWYGS